MMSDSPVSGGNRPDAARSARKVKWIVFFVRWWSAGAMYFLIGWGTRLGQYDSIIDLVFFLGMAIGLFNTLMVNPALKMLFDVGWHKSYGSSTALERAVCRIKDISLAMVTVILVTFIYEGINRAALVVFSLEEGQVFLPGEPLLFGLFYVLVTIVLLKLIFLFKFQIKRRNKL